MISKKDLYIFRGAHRILLKANDFICLCPHSDLTEYVSNYNITFPKRGLMPAGFTIIPCGCSTLTIENSGSNLSIYLEGPTTKPYIVGNRANQLEMLVTIEFKAAGLYAFTGINQMDLVDDFIPFEAVNCRLNKLILEAVERAENIYELVTGFDLLLLENIYADYNPQLKQTLQSIIIRSGNIDVKKLSDEIYYSERHLNRLFKQHIGVGIKSFSRLLRINNSFHLLKNSSYTLTYIADVMGFYDLSHFIRDFTLVCGVTPQEYRNNMSDFYINTTKF